VRPAPSRGTPPAVETTTTTTELFVAPREDESADGTTTTSELFLAPREDEPER
jgi:hypothetical protein